jgi:hypothetical protein
VQVGDACLAWASIYRLRSLDTAIMATIALDIDLPPGVTVTAYQRCGDGHGFEVSWPLPQRCRCDGCGREDQAHLEFRDRPQVIRDLDLWGQPSTKRFSRSYV